jgi:hypothetical protein
MSRPCLRSLRAAVRLFACALGILGLLLIPALVLAPLFAWSRGSEDPLSNLSLGLVCSLITWLFIAVFHLNREKIVVTIADRRTFLAQARILLDEMGYETIAQSADSLTTRPRFNAYLLGGGLRVEVDGNRANLIGPKISAEILRHRLRLVHHLYRVQEVLESQRKPSEPLLKRVEISLRLKPEQLAAVQASVLAPLSQAADVVCDVFILVQSEEGLRESTIEEEVRPWAQKHEIPCDIHKHHSKYYESALVAK